LWHSFLFIPKFGAAWFPIVFPGWTLSYEMLFYSVFGTVLALVHRHVGAICMICFAVIAVVSVSTPSGANLNTDLCLEFVFGVGISEWVKRVPGRNAMLGGLCIAASLVAFFLNRFGPGGSLRWGIPSLCLVMGVIQFEDAAFLRSRACRLLGDASYSIYLFHILIMLVVQQCTNRLGIDLHASPWTSSFTLVCIALVGGIVLDLLVVEPMTKAIRDAYLGSRRRKRQPPATSLHGPTA